MKFKLKDYIIWRMHRMDSNPAHGIYHPTPWISIHSDLIPWISMSGLRSPIHLQAQSALTNPCVSSICTHKSVYGLTNLCIASEIYAWAHKSARIWVLGGLDISYFVIIIYSF